MSTFTTNQVLDLYKSEAERHGEEGTSTIQDMRTRHLELEAISRQVRDGERVLEIGCGNGYVAQRLVERFDIELDAMDLSPDMVEIASRRDMRAARGRVRFLVGDVLTWSCDEPYGCVFTERCLQNLPTWDDQARALANIAGWLRPGGRFIMHESFTSGHENLNAARGEVGLPPIAPPWHNLFFDERRVKRALADVGCEFVDEDCFLSGYYFGSRVLMPKLLDAPAKAKSSSVLNDFFCALPAAGDFCPMKILRFQKRV